VHKACPDKSRYTFAQEENVRRTNLADIKVFAALLLACACALAPAARAEQLRGPGALQSLVAPLVRYPDAVIIDVAAAARDPRLLNGLPAELASFVLSHPDWARDFAYAFEMQQNALWQQVDALRAQQGGYPPVAGIPQYSPLQTYAPAVIATPFIQPVYVAAVRPVVVRPAVRVVRYEPRPAVVRRVHAAPVFHGFVSSSSGSGAIVSRNGGPSPAAQLQNAHSAAFVVRAHTASQPSPAQKLQQRRR